METEKMSLDEIKKLLEEKYEIYEDGIWKPFGVNCESDNPVLNKIIRDAIDNVRCY